MKYNITDMKCLDIYLSSLPEKKYNNIQQQIKPTKNKGTQILSWDICSQHYFKTLDTLKTNSDIKVVKAFAEKENWKNEIDVIFNDTDFEALIITDSDQKILWVNDGFSEMTGYSKKYALNKKPYFLQGANTSAKSRKRIRTKLKSLQPFTEIITNYRKDNTPYECEVKIIPMFNEGITHYLAIEKKVVGL